MTQLIAPSLYSFVWEERAKWKGLWWTVKKWCDSTQKKSSLSNLPLSSFWFKVLCLHITVLTWVIHTNTQALSRLSPAHIDFALFFSFSWSHIAQLKFRRSDEHTHKKISLPKKYYFLESAKAKKILGIYFSGMALSNRSPPITVKFSRK